MRFSEEFLTELRARTDIEELIGKYTDIKNAGSRSPVALCPFHTEKTPSFHIYRDTQSYYCFGCGMGGDAIHFIRNIERLDYTEAVRYLCERVGMRMPTDPVDDEYTRLRRRCYEANREAARFFYSCLSQSGAEKARAYIEKRQLLPATVKHFGLGYAPDSWDSLVKHLRKKGFHDDELVSFDLATRTKNGGVIDKFRDRLMFPIIDLRGNVTAFGGRVFDATAKSKYINSSDTPVYKKGQGIYALNFAKNVKGRKLILCEGYMDVISMHQSGFENAVAALGTAFTPEQISLLARYCDELTLSFDSDTAGVKATQRALSRLANSPMKIKIMQLDGGKDPDEILKSGGKYRMEQIISTSLNSTEFALNQAAKKYDVKTTDGRLGYLNECVNVLSGINNAVELDLYVTKLANELSVSRDAISAQVKKTRAKYNQRKANEEFDNAARIAAGEDRRHEHNPEKRDNRRACAAEEQILSMLIMHPDYYGKLKDKLTEDIFVTKLNLEIFREIKKRIEENRSPELMSFGENSSNEQISYIAKLVSMGNETPCTLDGCEECIKTLIDEKTKKNIPDMGAVSDRELAELIKNRAKNKK